MKEQPTMPEPISSTMTIAQGITSNLLTDLLKGGLNKVGRALFEKTIRDAVAEALRQAPGAPVININVNVVFEEVFVMIGNNPRVEVRKTQVLINPADHKLLNEKTRRENNRTAVQTFGKGPRKPKKQ
jgi:hypothetical protein